MLSCWSRFPFVRLELRRLVDGARTQRLGQPGEPLPEGATRFNDGDPRPVEDHEFLAASVSGRYALLLPQLSQLPQLPQLSQPPQLPQLLQLPQLP